MYHYQPPPIIIHNPPSFLTLQHHHGVHMTALPSPSHHHHSRRPPSTTIVIANSTTHVTAMTYEGLFGHYCCNLLLCNSWGKVEIESGDRGDGGGDGKGGRLKVMD
jgi:hypothetical protein